MENEQTQQPTYEQVVQAYNGLLRELEITKSELQALRTDKLLEKLEMMLGVLKDSASYPKEIVTLATWHVKQMMAKPKN